MSVFGAPLVSTMLLPTPFPGNIKSSVIGPTFGWLLAIPIARLW